MGVIFDTSEIIAIERKSHDLIIAATALSMDYSIITANPRDFRKIEGLKLETV